jgi:hypothetical protein
MSSRLGPLDVSCDAPPYSIVTACHRIGMESPEDVPWFRLSHLVGQHSLWRQLLRLPPWRALSAANDRNCRCGRVLPQLEHYTFTLLSGEERFYFLGQCDRCHAIYWEEGQPKNALA